MALSIKDPEVDRLARRYARQQKTSITAAIKLALVKAATEGGRFQPEEQAQRLAAVQEIQARWAAAGPDFVSADEVDAWMFDENGAPH